MKEYKLFIQRIGLLGFANLLVAISGIILIPIITKNISTSNYGVWVQANNTVTLISLMGNFGLSYTMVRFLAAKKDKKEIQENFYSIVFFVILTSTIVSIIFLIFSKNISIALFNGNMFIGILIPAIVFLTCMNVILINFFRTFQQMKIYSIFTVLQTYINVALVSYFVIFGYGINGAIIGVLITQLLIFLLMLLVILSDIGFKFPKFKNFKEYLSFGLPTVPGSLSQWISDSSDRYVIGLLLGVTFVGIYSPGYTLGNVINMLSYPFSLILPAALANYYDNGEINKVKTMLHYSFKYYLVIAIPSIVGLSLLSKQILLILSTAEIASKGYLVTPFVALGGIFLGSYTIFSQSIVLKKKTKIIGILWIIMALLNVVLNIIFVPYFGILGSAVITLITYIFAFVITAFYSFKYISFEIDFKFLAKIILASSLIAVIILILNPNGILSILIVIGVSILVYIISLLILGIDKKEIKFFKDFLINKNFRF